MTGVSDFSTKLSRHVSQRLHTSIAPLTEANLYRHTVTSPPSQEAKLKHILGYVELQRELIALEEDLYRSVTDKGHWNNRTTINNKNTILHNNIDNVELHSSQLAPHVKNTQYPDDEEEQQEQLIFQQKQQQQQQQQQRRSISSPSYHQRKNSSPNPYTQQRPTPPPHPSPALYLQQHHQHQQQQQQQLLNQSRSQQTTAVQAQTQAAAPAQRHLDSVPDGLDPTMALPRALPRSMTHHDQTLYRDSFYSGIGQENDWRQLEELDPDSLAGIHLYGDTSDLQPHPHQAQQPSPAAASSPLNKYPTYEFTPAPAPRDSDWQHERHLQQLQQQAILRQLQYPDDDDDDDEAGKVQMATRHRRQHSIAQAQQLQFEQQRQQQQQQQQRQLVSPPPTLLEKEKKASRFSSRFSFLTRRRQPQQQHQRHDSMPTNTTNEPWLNDSNFGLHRLNSIGHQPRRSGAPGAAPPSSGPGATTPIDEEQQFREETMYPGGGKNKSNSRVKQMFRDVFGISKKKSNSQSPDLAFRDISLPSTHIRSSSTPAHHQAYNPYGHQQHLDQPINSQYHYSTVVAQRKGLVTPVSRPDTAQSSYQNNNNQPYNSKSRSRARESLVDPVQQLGFQKMEFDEDDDLLQTGAFSEGHAILQSSPFGGGQTSLTPPPASSVLRHSSPPHRGFFNGSQEYEQPVLITAAVVSGTSTPQGTFSQQQQQQSYAVGPLDLGIGGGAAVGGRTSRTTRPSSQMTAMPKDYVDSGCDSTGGHEHPYTTTASNATTLNPSHQHHATNTTTTTTIKGGSIYSQQQQQQQQQPYLYNSSQQLVGNGGGQGHHQHKKSLSYDYDRAMTMSSYDNGPTIVSMAQVQKVDLEGLRQGHHNHHSLHQHQLHLQQHTPPSHSHHLGMVAVESPFA